MSKYYSSDQIALLEAAQAEADQIHAELEKLKGTGSPREYTLKFALIDAMHRINFHLNHPIIHPKTQ